MSDVAVLLMATWNERAFDLVVEITKQVLTLSTGVIAISVAFLTDVARNSGDLVRWLLGVSWIVFLVAVIFGMLTLMAAAGIQREAAVEGAAAPTIDSRNLKRLGGVQLISFGVALLLLMLAGFLAF
ncbi:hypothetical protein LTH96_02605 [Nesterenkonia sp. LB17]|uniref:hypothetical protein n=1 Tax=Nesterenkonia sp. LB17 TaxID=2901230 RepID=UPI001F4CAF8C|nr:hypothetical protein [Nesterenkonia sp. LB17]MCH8564633.1 hypothetical protein [Nesterenkonia sp. LB17]